MYTGSPRRYSGISSSIVRVIILPANHCHFERNRPTFSCLREAKVGLCSREISLCSLFAASCASLRFNSSLFLAGPPFSALFPFPLSIFYFLPASRSSLSAGPQLLFPLTTGISPAASLPMLTAPAQSSSISRPDVARQTLPFSIHPAWNRATSPRTRNLPRVPALHPAAAPCAFSRPPRDPAAPALPASAALSPS